VSRPSGYFPERKWLFTEGRVSSVLLVGSAFLAPFSRPFHAFQMIPGPAGFLFFFFWVPLYFSRLGASRLLSLHSPRHNPSPEGTAALFVPWTGFYELVPLLGSAPLFLAKQSAILYKALMHAGTFSPSPTAFFLIVSLDSDLVTFFLVQSSLSGKPLRISSF